MAVPNKRQKLSVNLESQADYVSFGADINSENTFTNVNNAEDEYKPFRTPTGPKAEQNRQPHHRRVEDDPRHARDRPKHKYILPGYEPWVLVRTKFRRRFVHNTKTKESFWRIPKDVMPGVIEFEKNEKEKKEKADNAKWAEEQLREMGAKSKAEKVNRAADEEGRRRRRRSESLQREDEEAFMAELAAQAEHAEEQDAREAAEAVKDLKTRAQEAGLESDSEYEVVEVTDTEGEDDDDDDDEEEAEALHPTQQTTEQLSAEEEQAQEDLGPVEFGEDDIAYQLAAMGEEYGLDPGEYGEDYNDDWEEGDQGLPLSEEDAANLFRDLLDDYKISPFTPWDKIIADESENSILNDDRYTVLPNMRARKEIYDQWVKDKAAEIQATRAAMEIRNPKIPYLAFLQDHATPKLFWPEFKRKFKKDSIMADRKLSDKDREKLYRDHINRLKLPESTRKADLQSLLKSIPLKSLSCATGLDGLPQELLSHLHYISLPSPIRDPIVTAHIKTLPEPPEADDLTDEQANEEAKKRDERRRRERAMAEREKQVVEERRKAEKDEARARRDLREEERELQRAMVGNSRGLQRAHLE